MTEPVDWKARAEAAEKLRDEALQERDEVREDEEYLQKRIETAERELSAARQVAFNEGIRAKELEDALDGSPVASQLFVDLLKQKCDAEKARADAAEKESDKWAEMWTKACKVIAEERAASKVDANPVAWQNRYRSRSRPSEEWSEWSEWRDGKQPELRTKAEDGGCYDTEERPLYAKLEAKPC